jgi:nicotinic acid mononucleotide adenylyltransferase
VILILGADAFRGPADLAPLAGPPRTGARRRRAARRPVRRRASRRLVPLWRARRTADSGELLSTPAGRILVVPTVPREISASAIRAAFARGGPAAQSVRALLPPAVWDYISHHRLYAA